MIQVKRFIVNPLQENTYLLSDSTGECIFVDPGFYFPEEEAEIKKYISENNLKPVLIANTHGHFDHMMGVEFLRNEYKIPFIIHPEDVSWVKHAPAQGEMFGFNMKEVNPPDGHLEEKKPLKFGNTSLEVIHVPGHSPGHVVFYDKEDKLLLAGDVLFYGGIGRTDLPGGDFDTLVSNIQTKLFRLPPETKVYCGHGPATYIGFEKKSNPFLT